MESFPCGKENEPLLISLYGKAKAGQYGEILQDESAAQIVEQLDYDFTNYGNRFLHIYMGIRAAMLDGYANAFIAAHADGVVLHLGCGLDSRIQRVQKRPRLWIDLDLPQVIEMRRQFFEEDEGYRMLASSVTHLAWLKEVEAGFSPVLVLAEGLSMYLTAEENKRLFFAFRDHFAQTDYVFDAYSRAAAAWYKWKNPGQQKAGAVLWGLDDPRTIEALSPGIHHIETRYFTERHWSARLYGRNKVLFRILYGNALVRSFYRVYAFRIE